MHRWSLHIPNQTIAEGATFTTISLDDYVTDVDNADTRWPGRISGNTALTVSIAARVATITTQRPTGTAAETITFTRHRSGPSVRRGTRQRSP